MKPYDVLTREVIEAKRMRANAVLSAAAVLMNEQPSEQKCFYNVAMACVLKAARRSEMPTDEIFGLVAEQLAAWSVMRCCESCSIESMQQFSCAMVQALEAKEITFGVITAIAMTAAECFDAQHRHRPPRVIRDSRCVIDIKKTTEEGNGNG